MVFGLHERGAAVRRLEQETFDLLVVGGGITGAGILRDAVVRGLKVALVERDDFASGTSSRSSKLVHGGIRYLEQYNFALVFESTQERARLMGLARHLVRPLPFLMPVHAGAHHGVGMIDLGMWLYDVLGTFRNYRLHQRLGAAAVHALEPLVRSDGLRGALRYYDAVTDDFRLTVENVRSAVASGAVAVSRAEVRSVAFREGRVHTVAVLDRTTGRTLEVRTRCVVCSTGPWTEETLGRMDAAATGPRLRPTKGVHLVVPFERLPLSNAVVMVGPRDGRMMFTVPWHGATVLGTTDTDLQGPSEDVFADRDDADYLLETANAAFPSAGLRREDVIGTWAGVRPLINTEGVPESQVSREHQITSDPRGIVTIAGGKLTTYRLMATAAVNAALPFLDAPKGSRTPRTKDLPLPCAGPLGGRETWDDRADVVALAAARKLPPDVAGSLLHSYGVRVGEVLDLAGRDPALLERLHPALPFLRVEVVHAARCEMAMSLVDVFARRIPLLLVAPDQGVGAAADAAALMAGELGWDAATRDGEVARFVGLADRHMACVRGG